MSGSGYYRAEQVGQQSVANHITRGARAFRRIYTPLQRGINLIIQVTLFVALFCEMLLVMGSALNHTPLVAGVSLKAKEVLEECFEADRLYCVPFVIARPSAARLWAGGPGRKSGDGGHATSPCCALSGTGGGGRTTPQERTKILVAGTIGVRA